MKEIIQEFTDTYLVSSTLGAALIPLVIFLAAVFTAAKVSKKYRTAAWGVFALGVVLELLSLIGNGRVVAAAASRVNATDFFFIRGRYALLVVEYLVITVLGATQIRKRA